MISVVAIPLFVEIRVVLAAGTRVVGNALRLVAGTTYALSVLNVFRDVSRW